MSGANVVRPVRGRKARVLILAGLVTGSVAVPVVAHAQDHAGHSDKVALRITGEVRHPEKLTLADLAKLPQKTMTITFKTDHGDHTRTETGPLLSDLIPPKDLNPTLAQKNGALSYAMLITAADGYGVALAYGEIDPEITKQSVIIALTEDGKPLTEPRLVVPADAGGGRNVQRLVEIHVIKLAEGH